MTEAQRDYLADLALKKGVRISDADNVSASWASKKIEELKSLPDAVYAEQNEKIKSSIDKRITNIKSEVSRWTFQA